MVRGGAQVADGRKGLRARGNWVRGKFGRGWEGTERDKVRGYREGK
jgi:hypothetical protein